MSDDQKPYSVELSFTLLASDMEEAGRLCERLDDYATEELGFFGEGGAIHRMRRREIVPDSPLARHLKEEEDKRVGAATKQLMKELKS